MKAVGYAVVIAALVGGSIFVMGLLSGLERQRCDRLCPNQPDMVRHAVDIGPWQYTECMCK